MEISPKLKKTLLALTIVSFTSPAVLAAGDGDRERNRDESTMQQRGATDRDATDRDGMGAAGVEGTMGAGSGTDENRSDWRDDDDTDRRTQPYTEPGATDLNTRDRDTTDMR